VKRRRILAAVLGSTLLAGLGLAVYVTQGAATTSEHADCIIVPGARVHADGTPGHILKARIQHAVNLLKAGRARAIIFTGGYGESGPCESIASKEVAIKLGAPTDVLAVETKSHTTCGNFYYAAAVMREHGWRSCLVCTDPFHVRRCLLICADLGLQAYPEAVYDSPGYTWPRLRAWYTARECAAMGKYWWQKTIGAPTF